MRPLFFILGSCFCLAGPATAQSDPPVTLRWKIAPSDTLYYVTTLQTVDNAAALPAMPEFPASLRAQLDSLRILSRLNLQHRPDSSRSLLAGAKTDGTPPLRSMLTRQKPNVIGVTMFAGNKNPQPADTTRGAVFANGGVASFYLPYPVKNTLALWFALPEKPVAVNDSWALDVHFITMPNFKGDSLFSLNKVTLRELKRQGQDSIAVLVYDLQEYLAGDWGGIPSKTAYSFQAIGEFSITRGKWLRYDGIMSMQMEGFLFNVFDDVNVLYSMRPE